MAIDPVCGMQVSEANAAATEAQTEAKDAGRDCRSRIISGGGRANEGFDVYRAQVLGNFAGYGNRPRERANFSVEFQPVGKKCHLRKAGGIFYSDKSHHLAVGGTGGACSGDKTRYGYFFIYVSG